MLRNLVFVTILPVVCFVTSAPRMSGATLVTSYLALNANDSVNWAQFGPTVPSGSTGTSSFGSNAFTLTANGAMSTASPQFVGVPGQDLLTMQNILALSSDDNGPIFITFTNPVSAAGAFVNNNPPSVYSTFITAYDGNTVLGSFQSGSDFIGIVDRTNDITKIEFSSVPNNTFVLGAMYLNDTTGPSPASAPEPSTMLLLAAGLIAGACWRGLRALGRGGEFS